MTTTFCPSRCRAEHSAFARRHLALAQWLDARPASEVAPKLLASATFFAERGNLPEAAATEVLLGLLHSDREPACALRHLERALPKLDAQLSPSLARLAELASAFCLAAIGRNSQASAKLRKPLPHPADPEDALAGEWLEARAQFCLGNFVAAESKLRRLLTRFLENRRYPAAILTAVDLAQLASAEHRRLLSALECSLPPGGEFLVPLRAFRTLLADLSAGQPFAEAASIFPLLVSTAHRFGSQRLQLLVAPESHRQELLAAQPVVRGLLADYDCPEAYPLQLAPTTAGRILQRILDRHPEVQPALEELAAHRETSSDDPETSK